MRPMHLQDSQATTLRRGLVYSDERLTRDVQEVASLDSGIKLYRFRYRWNATEYVGVMAQDIAKLLPDAVSKDADGYLLADYHRLGLQLRLYQDWLQKGHLPTTAAS
jgi:hypothetical protein